MSLANANLFAALRAAFPADLDQPAIELGDGERLTYSWRDIERATAMLANLLVSLELPENSRIAVQAEKSIESLLLYLAVLRAGYVYVPLNTAYQASEIDYFVNDVQPSVVICTTRHFTWVSRIAFKAGVMHVFTLDDDRSGSVLERATWHSDQHMPAIRNAHDLASIIYTSGTTGRSKGAMLSHGNLLSNARVLKDFWGWKAGDVLIHALPIFHVHGLFVASHGALLNGSRMIWFNRFDPKPVMARFPDATLFMGVPTFYVRLLAEPSLTREVCRNMRLFISGSAPLLVDTFDTFKDRTGHVILERYGMSETVMLTSNPYEGKRRSGTVGVPLPGVQVRIRDELGATTSTDEIGAIEVNGPNVFQGYWRQPEKTLEAFVVDASGTRWFKTGDVGRFSDDGHLTIVGRSKDLVITGGYNVYPAEIESYVNALPGVAETAVIGVPHPDFGEAVVAVVVARDGTLLDAQALLASLKSKIANFKVPKELFVADELPRNAMGKVQKNVLRDRYRALFE